MLTSIQTPQGDSKKTRLILTITGLVIGLCFAGLAILHQNSGAVAPAFRYGEEAPFFFTARLSCIRYLSVV